MTPSREKPKVYRLQGLPDRPDFDRLAATQLIASVISDPTLTADDIHIYSLATDVEPYKRWNRKVATVMFKHTPTALSPTLCASSSVASEWLFEVPGQKEPLVLDSHFLGLTVLNDVSVARHRYDCIALSGLASHPFGSWQPKGDDKSYMWIRDTLPTSTDGVRFILYGYDTTLRNSNSFQKIVDIANTLYLTLQTNGWESPSAKPLVFLAHSLGGVLLKQLLVLLAGANDSTQFMLSLIKGAIFFGTPSRGMAVEQLLAMVGDQPNKDLVETLSERSEFLPRLETQFSGISQLQRMRLFWAYETKTSLTVQERNGVYSRSGARSIMVDHQSATGSRAVGPSSTIQIDADHSDMVKFNRGAHMIPIITNKIQEMCSLGHTYRELHPIAPPTNAVLDFQYGSDTSYREEDLLADARSSELVGWDYDVIISALKAPERDQRYDQVDRNFEHTFSWAFEDRAIGLSQWLREGAGIFWINGKPGSGKSTFMKFLLSHSHTKELLHHWEAKPDQFIAKYFFHHRGTHLQKSFEGLLASILSQLLEGDPRLRGIVGEFLSERSVDTDQEVHFDVNSFFQHCKMTSESNKHHNRMVALLSENPSLQLHCLLQEHLDYMRSDHHLLIKEALLGDYDKLSIANQKNKVSVEAQSDTYEKLSPSVPARSDALKLIIQSWCESIDIHGRIRNFLREARLCSPDPNIDRYINRLVERQRVRQKRQIHLQSTRWTRSDLEEVFRRVFDQDTFDLKICLFFDALDEYAGRPEIISTFLKDLVKAKPTSRTRAKILFTSRPWTVFHDHFNSYPSISIHEHTMGDINQYCAGSLPKHSNFKAVIRPFVGEIADRARGVFVWVKLVMTDLVALLNTTSGTDEQLSLKLRRCLDSLPDELEEYYSTIIHRLPVSTRRQSYILLECLSLSSEPISLDEVSSLLACGVSDSMHGAQDSIQNGSAPGSIDPEGYTRTISGGMVDFVPERGPPGRNARVSKGLIQGPIIKGGGFKLQLMHQTVKDWVESPTFKHTILGDLAAMTCENGHSFLVKYYIYRGVSDDISRSSIVDHAVNAEMTTGVSQYTYLSQLPADILERLSNENSRWKTTKGADAHIQEPSEDCKFYGLKLAISNGLSLYLSDLVQHDKFVFRQMLGPFLFDLLRPKRYNAATQLSKTIPGRLESAKLILNHGYEIQRYPSDLSLMFDGIWRSPDQGTAEMYIDLLLTAANNRLPLDVRINTGLDPDSPTSLLHLSPPILAGYLLDKGADPNMTNSAGQTPLDYILGRKSVFRRSAFGFDWLYHVVQLLDKKGARRSQNTRYGRHDISLLQRLIDAGYDISPLVTLFDQSWFLEEDGIILLDPRIQEQYARNKSSEQSELPLRSGVKQQAARDRAVAKSLRSLSGNRQQEAHDTWDEQHVSPSNPLNTSTKQQKTLNRRARMIYGSIFPPGGD